MLATVYGDVHDIGKNLVNTILSNNGYTVFDLGKQVPVQTIIDKAIEVDADGDRPVGAAGLDQQADAALRRRAAPRRASTYPVLIGGAAINRNFGRRAALVDGEVFYEPGVFYCKDAFEGLDTVNALADARNAPSWSRRSRAEAFEFKTQRRARTRARAEAVLGAAAGLQGHGVARRRRFPPPPFWGARGHAAAPRSSWDGMFAGMDLKTLYRLHWGARGSGAEYDALIREDFEPRRLALQREAQEQGWLEPARVLRLLPRAERGPGPGRLRPVRRSRPAR